MRFHSLPIPLFRAVAAVLIAVVAIGASWAPTGSLQCDACRRDLTGNVICTKRAEVRHGTALAGPHACCQKTSATDTQVVPTKNHPADSCPTKCAPCCLPQA